MTTEKLNKAHKLNQQIQSAERQLESMMNNENEEIVVYPGDLLYDDVKKNMIDKLTSNLEQLKEEFEKL